MTRVVSYEGETYIAEIVNDEVKKVETLIEDRFLPCEFPLKEEKAKFDELCTGKVILPFESV
jgi:hypothetical protein